MRIAAFVGVCPLLRAACQLSCLSSFKHHTFVDFVEVLTSVEISAGALHADELLTDLTPPLGVQSRTQFK